MIHEKLTQEQADAIPDPKYVVWNFGVYDVYTGEDMPVIDLPIIKVSRRQMFLALHQLGILAIVQNWRDTQATEAQQIEFDTAGEFASDWPTLIQAATALGMNDEQRLAVFELAQTL